jgi:uncharacterized protein (DUF1684 family)
MEEPIATAWLWDYRRRVADLYAEVRATADPTAGWDRWRTRRDALFADHPQSAVEPATRKTFGGLLYFDYDPAWRVSATVEPAQPRVLRAGHSAAGQTAMRRFALARFTVADAVHVLSVYWLQGYGGGLFLPFRDATSGTETYGGGRYLLDTAKGADLGGTPEAMILDFNFAYHPSCVYSSRWSCPLAPPENRLTIPVRAGERLATQTTE